MKNLLEDIDKSLADSIKNKVDDLNQLFQDAAIARLCLDITIKETLDINLVGEHPVVVKKIICGVYKKL